MRTVRMRRPVGPVWLAGALAVTACSGRSNDAPNRAADASPSRAVATRDSAAKTPATKAPGSEWQIVPGRAGPVTRETSEAELRQRYGPSVVESTRIDIGEGETAAGAVLFPTDSLRRAEIVWQDGLRLGLRGSYHQLEGWRWTARWPASSSISIRDRPSTNRSPTLRSWATRTTPRPFPRCSS